MTDTDTDQQLPFLIPLLGRRPVVVDLSKWTVIAKYEYTGEHAPGGVDRLFVIGRESGQQIVYGHDGRDRVVGRIVSSPGYDYEQTAKAIREVAHALSETPESARCAILEVLAKLPPEYTDGMTAEDLEEDE